MSSASHVDVRTVLMLCTHILAAPTNSQGKLDMSDPMAKQACEELRLIGMRYNARLDGNYLQRACQVADAVLAATREMPR